MYAYKPVSTEKNWTIAYGHSSPKVTSSTRVSKKEAEQLLDNDVRIRLSEINNSLPAFSSFPQDLQLSLFSEYYRGSIGQSPKTRKLINKGKYAQAADEFLDNNQYREAEKPDSPIRGIRSRMERVSTALKKYQETENLKKDNLYKGGLVASSLRRRQDLII